MNNLRVTKQYYGCVVAFTSISILFICGFISWVSIEIGVQRSERQLDTTSDRRNDNENHHYLNKRELQKLGTKMQQRLQYIQNPKTCATRRKLHCQVHSTCGFACKINTLSNCLMLAYAMNRTMVSTPKFTNLLKAHSSTCHDINGTNVTTFAEGHEHYQVVEYYIRNKYKPNFFAPAVPNDLYDAIRRNHDNPFLWWFGQITSYIFRLKEETLKELMSYGYMEVFEKPIVGVHVRKSDKLISEAKSIPVDEYMKHVESWFKKRPKLQPRIFLATDDVSVLQEVTKKYPHIKVFNNVNFTAVAQVRTKRSTELGLIGIIHDIYMLSKCDYLVCTFSSNVCRVSFQLMNAERGNVTDSAVSLDKPWHTWDPRRPRGGQTLVVNVDMPKYSDND